MSLWRNKPIVVEAFCWTGGPDQEEDPEWILEAIKDCRVTVYRDHLDIYTLEGVMTAQVGDWIVRGIKGELYPCKPDIFLASKEPAEAATALPAIADPEATEPGVSPVVEALAAHFRRRGYDATSQLVEVCADEIAALIAEHQPPKKPDTLGELLAAMREFNVARRPNDSKAGILMWDDGSGQTVLLNMISFAVDTSSIGKAQWFDGKPGSAPAAIRAATEELRPKLESPVAPDYAKMLSEAAPFSLPQAQALLVCRVCGGRYGPRRRPDGTLEPFVLNHGKEFAHAVCLEPVAPAPPHVWRVPDATTPMDAWVWRASKTGPWGRGHYAGKPGCVWGNHLTSWCADGKTDRMCWPRVVLADPAHPDQAPPADWTPEEDH